MKSNFEDIIKIAGPGSEHYKGLRDLWCEIFGDEPGFVDAFYECFGDDIEGYVILDKDGRVCSELTCYPAGCYYGKTVYVSYAICTRADCRGSGLAADLTEYVKERIISRGGVSLVSPAEPSLEEFYARLGYEPVFHAAPRAVLAEAFDDELDEYEFSEEDDFDIVRPDADIRKIDPWIYNKYREAYLAGVPHIETCDSLLKAADLSSEGFYAINGGDAVCCVSESSSGQLILSELIISPILLDLSGEIDSEIAQLVAGHFAAIEVIYNIPGAGRIQSMAAGIGEPAEDQHADFTAPPYFGFPID